MVAYLRLTLRQGLRLPATWVLCALGVLATLAATALAILALGDPRPGAATMAAETAQTTAALVALWLLAVLHDADARSGFVQAADQTRGGLPARFLGRCAGAFVLAVLMAAPTAFVGALGAGRSVEPLYLLITTIAPAALMGAWASLLLALTGSAAFTVLFGLGLWLGGHLPWGGAGWDGGAESRLLAAWLPGGTAARHPDPVALAAAVGLLLVALACARPARATS